MDANIAVERVLHWFEQEEKVRNVTRWISIAFVVLIAYSLAKTTWLLLPEPEVSFVPPQARVVTSAVKSESQSLPSIAQFHLFGIASSEAPRVVAQQVKDAPPTKLNLVLMGILFSEAPEDAMAIIQDEKRQQDKFMVGDKIAANVELVEIYSDRVILSHRGKYETLFLDQDDAGKPLPAQSEQNAVIPSANSRVIDRTARRDLAKRLGEMRTTLSQDPTQMTQFIRAVAKFDNGQFQGFELAPGQDRSALARFGLRSGDIVTQVNGVLIDNPLKGMEVWNKLTGASELELTVLRGGQEITYKFGIEG